MTQPQEKAIECPDCRRYFAGRGEFVSHYRQEHLGELHKGKPRKPSGAQGTYLRYRCGKCKAGFSNPSALDQHEAEDHLKWRLTEVQRQRPELGACQRQASALQLGWVRIVGGGLQGLGKRAK